MERPLALYHLYSADIYHRGAGLFYEPGKRTGGALAGKTGYFR